VELALNVKEHVEIDMRFLITLMFFCCITSFAAYALPADEMRQVDVKYVDQLSDKKFDPIRNKFPIVPKSEASLPMLSDSSKITANQKKALEAYQGWGKDYVSELKGIFDRYVPQQSENIEWRYQESMRLIADIYSGKITWGDFNKQWSLIGPEYSRRVIATNAQIQQQQVAARNQQIQAQNQQAALERNKKIQYCQSLVQSMQINCPKQVYGTGNLGTDLYNMSSNFNPAGSFECGRVQSAYNNSCQ
jgi:hypothetical protein